MMHASGQHQSCAVRDNRCCSLVQIAPASSAIEKPDWNTGGQLEIRRGEIQLHLPGLNVFEAFPLLGVLTFSQELSACVLSQWM
jgi:hypothetical protein